MEESLLIDGKIPARTICPFRVKCDSALADACPHLGYNHEKAFSCAIARSFDMTDSKLVGKGQSRKDKEG